MRNELLMLNQQAKKFFTDQNYSSALTYYERASQHTAAKNNDRAICLHNMGSCHRHLGNLSLAYQYFVEALNEYIHLGEQANRLKEADKIQDLVRQIIANPNCMSLEDKLMLIQKENLRYGKSLYMDFNNVSDGNSSKTRLFGSFFNNHFQAQFQFSKDMVEKRNYMLRTYSYLNELVIEEEKLLVALKNSRDFKL